MPTKFEQLMNRVSERNRLEAEQRRQIIKKRFYNAILFTLLAVVVLTGCNNGKVRAYLVKETSYIHSTEDVEKCKFISKAKQEGLCIEEVDFQHAPYYEYKICRYCYSPSVVENYNRLMFEIHKSKTKQRKNEEWKDSVLENTSDEVKEAIIEEYLNNQENNEDILIDW